MSCLGRRDDHRENANLLCSYPGTEKQLTDGKKEIVFPVKLSCWALFASIRGDCLFVVPIESTDRRRTIWLKSLLTHPLTFRWHIEFAGPRLLLSLKRNCLPPAEFWVPFWFHFILLCSTERILCSGLQKVFFYLVLFNFFSVFFVLFSFFFFLFCSFILLLFFVFRQFTTPCKPPIGIMSAKVSKFCVALPWGVGWVLYHLWGLRVII